MAIWRKVIVSGSIAELNNLSVDNNVNITGSLNVGASQQIGQSSAKLSGSFSGSFQGALQSVLANTTQPTVVSYDVATGTFSYQSTGSVIATTASYALTASYVNPLTQSVFISGNLAITGSNNFVAVDAIYSGDGFATPNNRILTKNTNTGFGGIGDLVVYSSIDNIVLSAGTGTKAVLVTGSLVLGAGGASGSFSGSFYGDGGGLTNISASSIIGLQLNQIGSGSVTASISPDLGFRVNTNSQITGSLIVSSNINSAGNVVATGANSSLTGSFSGSFVGTTNLPDLTQGAGIATFTYDGSTTATVAVSGASALSSNAVTKWSGNAFVNSSITDSTNVTINNAGGVLVQAGGLYVTGSTAFHDSVFIEGNLTVAGTASFQHSDNLAIADQFILLNSGSSTFQDSGFVINTGNAGNSGSAFFLETAGTAVGASSQNGRFAVAGNVQPNATAVTAEEYAVTALISGSAPGAAVPQFGGTNLGQGNMWVNSSTSDIWIYA